jgi:hypothetical protein
MTLIDEILEATKEEPPKEGEQAKDQPKSANDYDPKFLELYGKKKNP